MNLFAVLITSGLLTSLSWAACPVASGPSSTASQESLLKDFRDAGFAHYRDGHYQIAAACYAEALRIGQVLGISNPATASDLSNMGDLAEGMGDYSESKKYYLRALDLLTQLGAADSGAAGDVYTKLGMLMQVQGLISDAATNYKNAVALLTRHAGAENWRTANALDRLGRIYLELGKLPDASNLVRKARTIAEKNLSPDNPLLITFFDSEAYLLCQSGKFKEAEKNWMDALKIAEHAYGENGIQYGFLLLHLGQMYLLIGDYPSAVTMLRRAVAIEEKITGSDPVDRALLVSSLATAYVKQHKLEVAKPLMLESREAIDSNCSASPMACSVIRSHLGEYYLAKGQWGLAEEQFEAALKPRENTLGEHPLVADSLISLARTLRKEKRKGDAKIYEAQAARILASQKNPLYGGGNTIDVRAFQAANR